MDEPVIAVPETQAAQFRGRAVVGAADVQEVATVAAPGDAPVPIADTAGDLLGNTATGNAALQHLHAATPFYDLRDDNIEPPCDANVWLDNVHGTFNQLCVTLVTPPVPGSTLEDLAQQLDALVTGGSLTAAEASGLRAKLRQINAHIAAGRITSALNQLQAFINQVTSLVNDGTLSTTEGDALIGTAQAIMAAHS